MTLAEALLEFESGFTVHREAGIPVGDYDGPRDMNTAPTGEPYVTLTSDGPRDTNEPVPCWYDNEELAAAVWLSAAKHYGTTGPCEHARNLYWLERPRFVRCEFVALNQAEALQEPALRESIHIDVGYVTCRLLVSRFKPDGTEDEWPK